MQRHAYHKALRLIFEGAQNEGHAGSRIVIIAATKEPPLTRGQIELLGVKLYESGYTAQTKSSGSWRRLRRVMESLTAEADHDFLISHMRCARLVTREGEFPTDDQVCSIAASMTAWGVSNFHLILDLLPKIGPGESNVGRAVRLLKRRDLPGLAFWKAA